MKDRLQSLRSQMKQRGISAYILTGSDPHLSEYVSDYWRTLEWLSGFSGSAGTIAVTEYSAALWTDFRYWIQAAGELEESFELMKEGQEETLTITQWLTDHLQDGDVAAINGWTISIEMGSKWASELSKKGISLEDAGDLTEHIWKDRAFEGADSIFEHPLAFSGESRESKIGRLKKKMESNQIDSYALSSLDDIAWLLNLRGSDIKYNPVFRSYLYITAGQSTLFTDLERLSPELIESLNAAGVDCVPYGSLDQGLRGNQDKNILMHPMKTPWMFLHLLNPERPQLFLPDLVPAMKALKNPAELEGYRKAMRIDGAQMVRLQIWLMGQISRGEKLSEWDVSEKISDLRSLSPDCVGDSFAPIPAYASNGALCHYEASAEKPVYLRAEGLFLLDSGGQYIYSTTDITRTFALGQVIPEMIRDYTLVLKGHVALSRQIFPKGAKGFQLDTVARQALWQSAMDYGHGTGHGVGSFLNVHEGPQSISPRPIDVPLQCGMIVSNEPGIYREGKWGIRIENLILVEKKRESEMGEFYGFETLTLSPYERELIDLSLLDQDEIDWINRYHEKVKTELSSQLSPEEREWLENRCRPLE